MRDDKKDFLKVILVLGICFLWVLARERAYIVSQRYIIQTVGCVGEDIVLADIQLSSAFGYSHIWWVELRAVYQDIDNPQDSFGCDRRITINVLNGDVIEAWFEQ